MKYWRVACAVGVVFSASAFFQAGTRKADFPISPVPYKDVQITDAFWAPRLEKNRTVSIPVLLDRYEKMGQSPDLRLIEAACYELAQHPDAALVRRIDGYLDPIVAAIRSRKQQWSSAGDGELLRTGNFLEASVAHFEATGSRKLLDVAIEIADDLDAVFGPGKRRDIGNHEGIKLGLVRLYRATGDEKYLKLAKFFLDLRGNQAGRDRLYGPYAQDHKPVKEQERAIGHTVRATYLYAPLTEIAALTGDYGYVRASERIWEDAASKRTYLTGGVGAYRDKEDYGDDYDLPNLSCWNEICAAYGNTLWNQRLFLLNRDARYVDLMERVLYNALLAGVSLSGDTFLYQAPLRAYGKFGRQPWFGPNCCPPNLARLLPQLGSLLYAAGPDSLYVNLFAGSKAEIKVRNTRVTVTQETRYPWDGAVKLTLNPAAAVTFTLYVRIPGWARNQPMPTPLPLYRYLPAPESEWTLKVNGKKSTFIWMEKGYIRVDRNWKPGDVVQLELPMPVKRVLAHPDVADDRGMVALQRGPLVFCLEGSDNPRGVFNMLLPDDAELKFAWRPGLLGGMGEITATAVALSRDKDGETVVRKGREVKAIPYYAFGNRDLGDLGEMTVWLAREEAAAVIPPGASIASTSRATSSSGNGTVAENYPGHKPPAIEERWYPNSQDGSGDISAIYDQVEPVNSQDGSSPYLRLHPQNGDGAWVQYDFAKPATVRSVEVYWKGDKQVCVLPRSWSLLYKDGNEWKPVQAEGPYPVAKDQFNKVEFAPVRTAGLRIEIQLQGKVYKKGELGPPDGNYLAADLTWYESGVIAWRVNQ